MAMIKCSECGKEISDKAPACIYCGCPMAEAVKNSPAPAENAPKSLSLNFNAVVGIDAGGKTMQKVYVNELKREVEFSIENSTQVNEVIKINLKEGSEYNYILFTAVTVTKSQPASPRQNTGSVETMKIYTPNWIVNYLKSRRFYTIMFLFIALFFILLKQHDFETAKIGLVSTSPFWAPSLIGKFFYPMHHVKRYIRKNNLEEAIRNDSGYMNVAISAYNANPSKRMLSYIKRLNAQAGKEIERQLAANKKK